MTFIERLGLNRVVGKLHGLVEKPSEPGGQAAVPRPGCIARQYAQCNDFAHCRYCTTVEQALRAGPRVAGFSTDLWTLPRVAEVIERLTQVRYHPGHVWRLLRGLNGSLPRPARRARARDETT